MAAKQPSKKELQLAAQERLRMKKATTTTNVKLPRRKFNPAVFNRK